MNQTTKETRRRSYDAVLPKRAARCRLILETLGNRELTASEITEELVADGRIPYFNRNYVAPRLTELKDKRVDIYNVNIAPYIKPKYKKKKERFN